MQIDVRAHCRRRGKENRDRAALDAGRGRIQAGGMRRRHCPKCELCRVVNYNPAVGWVLGSSAVLMAVMIRPRWIKRVNFKYSS